MLAALGLLVAALALVASGCGGGDGGGVTALPASSCTDVEYGGEGDPDVLIASDLPLQGGDRVQTLQMADAIRFVLEQNDWKAGDLNVALPVVRRLDGASRLVGLGQVHRERSGLRGERGA